MPEPDHHIDVHATAGKEGLSLKAKGAGLFVLLALSISGIVIIGYRLASKDSDTKGFVPLMFLLYVTYHLIATLDAVLGIRLVRRE